MLLGTHIFKVILRSLYNQSDVFKRPKLNLRFHVETLLEHKRFKNTAYCAKCLNEYLSSDILIDYFQDFSKLLHKINELNLTIHSKVVIAKCIAFLSNNFSNDGNHYLNGPVISLSGLCLTCLGNLKVLQYIIYRNYFEFQRTNLSFYLKNSTSCLD